MTVVRFIAARETASVGRTSNYPSTGLAFVNIANPNEIKDAKKQTRIRRHVMKKIGLSRRRGASILASEDSRIISRATPAFIPQLPQLCPYWQGLFLGLDLLDDDLVKLCLADAAVEFAQTDDYRAQFMGHTDVVKTLIRYNKSVEIIRHSLGLSSQGSKIQAAVATIIGLAFYDMRVRNFSRWTMHMDGLHRILNSFGDIGKLRPTQELRLALIWVEAFGSLIIDAPTRFSQLRAALPRESSLARSAAHQRISYICQTNLPLLLDLSNLLVHLSTLSKEINMISHKPSTANLLHDTTSWAQSLISLTHNLLALPRYNCEDEYSNQETSQLAMREWIRLAALIFVSTLICRSSGDELYCARNYKGRARKMLLASGSTDWKGLEPLRLWVLVLCAMIEDDRIWYVKQIAQAMQDCTLESWDEVLQTLEDIAWIDSLTAVEAATLGSEVEEYLEDDES